VTIGERRILLPADIEAKAERQLLSSGRDLHADVLVVPHHGSKTSSTPEFLAAVHPGIAVISVGAHNAYGHPNPAVVARYGDATLLRTDLNGDVTVSSDGTRLLVHHARDIEAVPTAERTPTASATVLTTPISR
jgi:competence protein ComEC